jgi:hypothetical protein
LNFVDLTLLVLNGDFGASDGSDFAMGVVAAHHHAASHAAAATTTLLWLALVLSGERWGCGQCCEGGAERESGKTGSENSHKLLPFKYASGGGWQPL